MTAWEGGEADLCPGFLVRWIAGSVGGGEVEERLTQPVRPVREAGLKAAHLDD